jgi:hypothetical protein
MARGNVAPMTGNDALRQAGHVYMGCLRAELAWTASGESVDAAMLTDVRTTSGESVDAAMLTDVRTTRQLALELVSELALGNTPDADG